MPAGNETVQSVDKGQYHSMVVEDPPLPFNERDAEFSVVQHNA